MKALTEGRPRMARLDELPDTGRLVTFSRVGTVSGDGGVADLEGYDLRALDLFRKADRRPIAGYLSSEVGPLAVTYGWRASARTGIPVVDAPCNGRAHPFGLMGSLGLHRLPDHITFTVAAGPAREMVMRADVAQAATAVRKAVARDRMGMAVVRNPVPASYVRKHAAPGALEYARRIGETLLRHRHRNVLLPLARLMKGRVLARGFIKRAELMEKDGFSIGHIAIRSDQGRQIIVPVLNEYMMVLDGGRRVATFPDLITIFDEETALPLASADAHPPRHVAVFAVPRRHLLLGSTMNDRTLLKGIEQHLQLRMAA